MATKKYVQAKTPQQKIQAAYQLLAVNSGFKNGDVVEIICAPERDGFGMGQIDYARDMRNLVGKHGTIDGIDEGAGAFFVEIEDTNEDFYWPFYCIRKWEPTTEISITEDYDCVIENDGSSIAVGCQMIPAEMVFKVAQAVKDRQAWYKAKLQRERDERDED